MVVCMPYCLDQQHEDWPAQQLFCRRLGITLCLEWERGEAFTLIKAARRYLIRQPWYWYRLIPALREYGDCKYHLAYLRREAGKVRTVRNRVLVEHILQQAAMNLVRESPENWPELGGLFSQKLAHLGYYDELSAERFKTDGRRRLQRRKW